MGLKKRVIKTLILSLFHEQYSNIPLFHHSLELMKKIAVKDTVISTNYRCSDPFNYLSSDFEILPMLPAASGE